MQIDGEDGARVHQNSFPLVLFEQKLGHVTESRVAAVNEVLRGRTDDPTRG